MAVGERRDTSSFCFIKRIDVASLIVTVQKRNLFDVSIESVGDACLG
jgi:hypothetical protein